MLTAYETLCLALYFPYLIYISQQPLGINIINCFRFGDFPQYFTMLTLTDHQYSQNLTLFSWAHGILLTDNPKNPLVNNTYKI